MNVLILSRKSSLENSTLVNSFVDLTNHASLNYIQTGYLGVAAGVGSMSYDSRTYLSNWISLVIGGSDWG